MPSLPWPKSFVAPQSQQKELPRPCPAPSPTSLSPDSPSWVLWPARQSSSQLPSVPALHLLETVGEKGQHKSPARAPEPQNLPWT